MEYNKDSKLTQVPEDAITNNHRPPGATFIDFENLSSFLEDKLSYPHYPADYILEILKNLPRHLRKVDNVQTAISTAYADFDALSDNEHNLQQALYMQGVEARYVPNAARSNATSVQLCIDAMEVLFHRSDINTFVIVTGDRDYLPLIQHLHRYGRTVYLVAFDEGLSTDLLENASEGAHFGARQFLSGESRRHLLAELRSENVGFNPLKELPHEINYKTLEIIEKHFGQYDEIYLTPLLRKLSEKMSDGEDHDPKSIIGDLEETGAVRLEKRRGDPHDYTVLIVNPRHPDIVAVREKYRDEGSMYTPDEVSYDMVDYYDVEDEDGSDD
jgi:uncharacterized protein (TIGR00288 family)